MASRIATIAEAVATALTAAAATPERFGETFTARRVYAPTAALETQKDLQVTVLAVGGAASPRTRAAWQYEDRVLVGIEKRLPRSVDPSDPDGNATLDELTELTERVQTFFVPGFRAGRGELQRAEVNIAPADVARRQRRYLAVLTLVFVST